MSINYDDKPPGHPSQWFGYKICPNCEEPLDDSIRVAQTDDGVVEPRCLDCARREDDS